MPTRRSHKGNTVQTTLQTSCTAADTTLNLVAGSTYPDGSVAPFVITLDPGQAGEEKCLVTSRTGNTLSGVTRGYDDTVAGIHAAGANVRHTLSAVELEEAAAHIAGTTSVHGIADTAALLLKTGGTMTGELVVPDLKVTGLTGTTLPTRLVGGTASGAPTTGTFQALDESTDATGKKFICTAAGTPGTWVQIGGGLDVTTIQTATVAASETTTGTAYGDLATVGPAVTVTVGASGRALVTLSGDLSNDTVNMFSLLNYAVSGATTVAAADTNQRLVLLAAVAGQQIGASRTFVVTGLTAGSNTFTMKYRVSAGTGTFIRRQITVTPI
jgi:hypothetical protein